MAAWGFQSSRATNGNLPQKITWLVTLGFKKESARILDPGKARAIDVQATGKMLAVIQKRMRVFGGGQLTSEITAENSVFSSPISVFG